MIPTYNERENIVGLLQSILALKIKDLHVVVVDDNSPDGTALLVKEYSIKNNEVELLLRMNNRGRGAAGKDGFLHCLKKRADVIVEMDADFSHDPKFIPKMIAELKNADVVLGSRRVDGSQEIGRSMLRRILTWGANLYISLLLGLQVKDCNSGYRCFKHKVLEAINLGKIESKGPAIVQEILFKASLKGFKIKEIPITFIDRRKGKSKLGIAQLAAGYYMVLKLKLLHMAGRI